MKFDKNDTAVVMIDPQNEVLSETGLGWPLLRESLHENNTVENMDRIFRAARSLDSRFSFLLTIFIPPTKGGSSTGRSKPTRLPQVCSLAKES